MDSHPPSAIITHARFLPHVLELIYDSNESEHHTVIVVGEFDPKIVGKAGNAIRLLKWTDVESQGATGEAIMSSAPSKSYTHSSTLTRPVLTIEYSRSR